jgi:tetratricopeptide (TPR) repeat protein
MTTTARRARKSFKEDQLVTTTFRLTEWAQEHFNQVIIGVVVLVAVVAVLVFASNSRENSARQAEREMGAALLLYEQGEFAAAKAGFQQIYDRHKGKQATAARFLKAECELREGNYTQATDDYDAYLERRADYPLFESAALIGKAMAFEGLQNYGEAAKAMAAAVETLDPEDPRYYDSAFHAGDFYLRAGNTGEALKHYQMVAEKADGDLKSRAAVAVSMLK